ncbi:hypothetical protein [Streptomyces malaysiensis]|uniref:hypothetical protein n=1 Tax=Streptomyces malaysiensis TaxID=92644 RepID=UPI002B2F33F6|nr:hypothetical protein R8789_00500 [Streptomyces malaysiensis]
MTQEDVGRHPARIERPSLPYILHPGTRTVVLGQALPPRDRHNLAHVLAITVRSPENPAERYWPGRLSGAQPLITGPRP